jgi:hypothetical protein
VLKTWKFIVRFRDIDGSCEGLHCMNLLLGIVVKEIFDILVGRPLHCGISCYCR